MAAVGATRLAATAGRTRCSRADAALDRLAAGALEAEVDSDGGDCDDALDALMGYKEDDIRTESLKRARAVKACVYRKTLPTSCPAAELPDDLPVTYQLLTEERVTVAQARSITFGTGTQ